MINTFKGIVKYSIIAVFGITGLFAITWLLSTIDWSLFKWASDLFAMIEWDFMDLFNYPNAWIFFSYIIGRDLIFFGLGLLLGRGRKR